LKTFISHYAAKRILEHHCTQHLARNEDSSEVQISLIDVGGHRELRLFTWDKMQSTIQSTITDDPAWPKEFSLSNAIEGLRKGIQDAGAELATMDRHSKSTFRFFQGLLNDGQRERILTLHCETALAAFATYWAKRQRTNHDASEDELDELSRVFFVTLILFLILPLIYHNRAWIFRQ
jgi:hypothetical protein